MRALIGTTGYARSEHIISERRYRTRLLLLFALINCLQGCRKVIRLSREDRRSPYSDSRRVNHSEFTCSRMLADRRSPIVDCRQYLRHYEGRIEKFSKSPLQVAVFVIVIDTAETSLVRICPRKCVLSTDGWIFVIWNFISLPIDFSLYAVRTSKEPDWSISFLFITTGSFAVRWHE